MDKSTIVKFGKRIERIANCNHNGFIPTHIAEELLRALESETARAYEAERRAKKSNDELHSVLKLANSLIAENESIETDRDRWRSRAEELEAVLKDDDAKLLIEIPDNEVIEMQANKIKALERALRINAPCLSCIYHIHGCELCHIFADEPCALYWQFDEVRFTEGGEIQ
jgi:hypothetical protein